jgi:hypothetical protein
MKVLDRNSTRNMLATFSSMFRKKGSTSSQPVRRIRDFSRTLRRIMSILQLEYFWQNMIKILINMKEWLLKLRRIEKFTSKLN